jgi:hypothetical protein
VFDTGAEVSSALAFESVGLPMQEGAMSMGLIFLGENQSKIQRLMLCFELERAHKFEPRAPRERMMNEL